MRKTAEESIRWIFSGVRNMSDKNNKSNNSTVRLLLRILFSLVCSLLIWVYVTDTVGTDIERPFTGVKVVFEGESAMRESRGLVISDVDTTSVKVNIAGNRRTVSSLDSADLTVVIDLNGITKTGNYSLAPKITFPAKTDTSVITSAVTEPMNISFYIDKLSTMPIPVVGIFNGSAAEGYTAEPMEFDSETVKIYGPEKVISQVDHALVEISRENVDKTISFESTFVLIDANGQVINSDEITYERDTVVVTLPIDAVKDVDLVVDLISGGGATKDNVNIEIEPKFITLTGDSETLAGVNNISLAKIDLAKVDDVMTDTFKIVIPNDTENTSGYKEATVTLTTVGLTKKTVRIEGSNISVINNSEGFVAEVMNKALENVVIRGPESVINTVSDVNVRAVADLADYGTATGIITVPVKIYVDGASSVGAMGEYKVYVNVSEEAEKE